MQIKITDCERTFGGNVKILVTANHIGNNDTRALLLQLNCFPAFGQVVP